MERFWSKVNVKGRDECWEWLAGTWKDGYGCFFFEGRMVSAHRVAYLLHYGNLDSSLLCMHQCNNPICCNPWHLELGTYQTNNIYKSACGRHGLSNQDIMEIRDLKGYYTQREIAKFYNVWQSAISKIHLGKRHIYV